MSRHTWIVIASLGIANAVAAETPLTDGLGDPLPPGAIMRLGTTRWRPGGYVSEMAFSPDGTRLVSWSTGALTIWDADTGKELRRVDLPGAQLKALAWLADGRGVSVISDSEGSFVWEFTDEKVLPPHKPAPQFARVMAKAGRPADNEHYEVFAFSPNGKLLAGGKSGFEQTKERDVVIWGLATNKPVAELPQPRVVGKCPANCSGVAFTPAGEKLLAFARQVVDKTKTTDWSASVFGVVNGKELRSFHYSVSLLQPWPLRAAISERYVACAPIDGSDKIRLWDLDNGDERSIVTGHKPNPRYAGTIPLVGAVKLTVGGETLVTGGLDGSIKTWDVVSRKELRTIAHAYPESIGVLTVALDGKRLACGGGAGIRHWDLTTGMEVAPMRGSAAAVTQVSITRDGATAATSSRDSCVCIWDLKNGREKRIIRLPGVADYPPMAVLTPDSQQLVSAWQEKIRVWNVANAQEVPLPELPADVKAAVVQFSISGKSLVVLSRQSVSLLDWPSGKFRRTFHLPEPEQKPGEPQLTAASVSPDGKLLATLSCRMWNRASLSHSVLDLWDVATGERVRRLVATGGAVARSAFFTLDGGLVYIGPPDFGAPKGGRNEEPPGEIQLFDPLTGKVKQSFERIPALAGYGLSYSSASGVSSDGRSVFCAGSDGVIHIYETATGKIRRSLSGHRDHVSALAVTGDGRRLMSGSHDQTALVWDISLTGFAPKNAGALGSDDAAKHWRKLLDSDAKAAYEAMALLASQPKTTVELIRAEIKPATGVPDDAALDRLLAELNDGKFAVREDASRKLDRLGEAAVAGMRSRLEKASPEARRRIVAFLDKHDTGKLTPEQLREIRALEILEQLNTPESRAVMSELAKGAASARLTQSASTSLARMSRK
jgi:WD40 repeat protein